MVYPDKQRQFQPRKNEIAFDFYLSLFLVLTFLASAHFCLNLAFKCKNFRPNLV